MKNTNLIDLYMRWFVASAETLFWGHVRRRSSATRSAQTQIGMLIIGKRDVLHAEMNVPPTPKKRRQRAVSNIGQTQKNTERSHLPLKKLSVVAKDASRHLKPAVHESGVLLGMASIGMIFTKFAKNMGSNVYGVLMFLQKKSLRLITSSHYLVEGRTTYQTFNLCARDVILGSARQQSTIGLYSAPLIRSAS